jgi:peptide chain release factor 2
MAEPDFWSDKQKANEIIRELKSLKSAIEPWLKIEDKFREIEELSEIVEASDTKSLAHLEQLFDEICTELSSFEFYQLLSDEHDKNNVILSINAGAGGTESCDWVSMLLRMYLRYAEDKNFRTETIDFLPGEEAGIKNVTVIIKGNYAYGYLKSEVGVHRLVRISPFDANKRRHTSFASVDVIPEITDDIDIKIEDADLKIDVYRSSGPGGQSVNTTDSAVRITHLPTGIVVQCQNERSQLKNKMTALKVLRARLYEKKKKEEEEKLAKKYAQKQDIAWGSQIRSYVLHPYNMVKDHRTDIETANTQAVLDGKIDEFIQAYLKRKMNNISHD